MDNTIEEKTENVEVEHSQSWIFNHLPLSDDQKAIIFKHIEGKINDNELAEEIDALARRDLESQDTGEPHGSCGSSVSKPTIELCEQATAESK